METIHLFHTDTSTVWSKVPIGDPDNPDPDPKKTVSDEDEKNVLNNTLTNADETFTYTVSKEIEKNMPSTAKYSKVVIKDAVDSCLTVDSVKFYAGDKDVTSSFAPTSANKGNYLEYAASSDLLNNKDFYGNNAGTTVKMVIKTHIDAKKVSIETLREHGHLVENDKKTETNIKIKNETTVTTTKADNQGTWDVDKKVTPPPTTTDSPIPSIKDPVKKVSDSDDLNWDATVKQDGEKTPGSHNRVTDVTNQWLYTLTQEIPAHTVELYHYKSFTITDAVDSCLSYDVKDITIKAGDKDYTDKFDITKGDDNSLTLTAKSDVLASDEFYGGKSGNKIVVSFPVKISADAKTLKDENLGHLEIGGKKMAHLQKVSDLQKLSGFTDLVKSKDNEYVYAFLNQAKSHIDSQIKYEGQTGVKDRTTDKVETAVETADPTIKKESSKYEWQVGDKVDYTINVGDANSNSIADNVVVTDESLPKAMLPDKDSITISSTFDKEKSGAPEDRDISKDAKIEYTEKGFVITIPKLYRGEAATIKLTCTAKEKSTYDSITDQWADCLEKANADKKLTCVNGEVIENRAFVTATLMLKDKDTPPDDLERVWVNTPHLNIKKSVEKKEYNVGETVKYTLVVTNVHEGTLARDIVITDQLQTPGETIVEGTIRLKDETGAAYDLGKKAGKDAEKPYLETQDDTSFKITTGMNLRYDGESPFKKLAEIDDKVHWKNKEGLTQEEWDAPITHTKFTVTYEAKINKEPADTNQFVNVATANQWLYTLTQEIPAHTVELYHYKSFTITDAVDSCLSYDVKDITIKAGDKDYTDKFDITKGDDNSLTLTAKSDVLASDEFYGGKSGNKIVVSFPVKISADAKTLKDENLGHLEIGGKKMAHLQKVSDLQKLSGFTDLVKSKDNEYVYAFLNQAKSHIDSQIKYEGQTGIKDRTTDKVETAVETADPTIKKESSKYEWQVGDKVDYTINVGDANSNSIADNVVVTDESLPKAMLPDKDSITISSTFDKEKSGAPEDRDISKDAKIEYTEKGFVITIPKLYRGEAATIKLTCTAKEKSTYDSITDQWADCLEKANADKKLTCVNGEVIENRAFVTATLMLKDKDTPPDDLERVWVNTPHLNIKKSVEKKEYNVGETVKYTLVVTNVHEGTLARDIVITDQLQTPGETIVEGTIRLKDETGAVYDLGKKAGKDAEKPYLETQDDTSFKITTGMNLRYDGESPFKKLAEIDDKVHWKNKEGLTQEEWDAPITHTKFTVTYEAKINKEPADTNQFVNVATAKGSNTDEVKDDEIVYLKTPVIKTEKESDKDSYQKGETAKYHLTVTQTREDRTAVNVVIKDALKDEDSEKEKIKGDTIKVYYNGNEFTPVSVKSDDTSFTIETGKNLTVKDKLEVTYDAEVLSDLNKDSITNIVKAKADNAYAEIELDVPVTKVTQNISARKTSNPASGTVVKQGGQIIYYIDVHNDSETTLKNVLVRDAVPELSTYVEGSASNNGKVMEINGKQYVTYVIDTLRAGSTQTLSFAVTVDEKATSEDVILNTAEIKETTEKDLNEDGNIPDDLWNEDFKETNTTKHPLSNWATDIKTVKVGTPDSYIEKRADSAVYDVGETLHYTIVAEQTTKDGKLTNAVVEDKDLPDGVDIDYDSIKVDGNTVPEQDTMTSDTNSIYLIRTKKGFKVVYPELSEKSTITFDAVINSEKLVGKKIPNKATIISDQTPEKEAVVKVKVPKNPIEKVIKKIINRKGVSGNSSPKGVKTGLSTHAGLFAGIAAALLAAAAILIKKRRNAKKKPMTLEKF